MLYSLNSSCIYIKSQIFQKTIRLPAEHNSNWQFAIYQSKVFSPPNAIKYILKHLQHTFKLLIYHTLTLYPSYSSLLQIHHYISENYQTSRGTQFNLTHCDLPIKRHLASKRNKYILKHLQHTSQLLIYHILVLYSLNSSCIYIKSQIFQKTIRLPAEHNSNWQFAIYQSKVFSPPNAIKYILKHLQHTFQQLIYHTLVLYQLNSSWIYIKSPTFQKTIRVIAEHNSIWHSVIY